MTESIVKVALGAEAICIIAGVVLKVISYYPKVCMEACDKINSLGGKLLFFGVLPLIVTVAIMIATSLVVTSGFVFNEVFVYWFPNFLFAFILLGIIFMINIFGEKLWGGFQIFSIASVFVGMIILINWI